MAAKSKRDSSKLVKWINTNPITIINAFITIALIIIVITVLIFRESSMQREAMDESLAYLAGMTASEIQSYNITNFDSARAISRQMTTYQNIELNQRRRFFIDAMQSTLVANRSLVNVFTVWRPNSLDNMDALYANSAGTDETGQFITGFSRERGFIEEKSYGEYRDLLDLNYVQNYGYVTETLSEPRSMTIAGPRNLMTIWVVDIWIPIFGGPEVVGVLGATVNLGYLQSVCEARVPYGTGRIVVCSNDGVIAAHYNERFRGTNILAPGYQDTSFPVDILDELREAIVKTMGSMEPVSMKTDDSLIVCYPLRTTSTMAALFTYNAISSPPWVLITTVPMAAIMAPIYAQVRFSIIFVLGAGILAAFVLFSTSRSLTQRTRVLQYSLEQASTMQDNLKYGLFLMDDKYNIQRAYSKALERILSVPSLQEKNLIELLASSLKGNEKEGFQDYLEMIFKRSFDEEMLESINPISEFIYFSNDTKEKKNLRTTFKLTEGGRGAGFILGTMEDITAEKELQNQLLEAENNMAKEMRSLFEVLQLDPRVLSDFIEDTEYEFTAINEVLKRGEHIRKEIMLELYQSVHAVKSNSLILNLENFSSRLHDLEGSIKIIQEKNEDLVPFDDILGLVLEIDEALKEKDRLKAAVSKIENFRRMHSESGNQEVYVLVETLTQVCSKTQAALNKKVKLVVEAIDDTVMDHGPRRVIKEVLTQLVRNSVYHGIEPPPERVLLGKDPEGELRLSIKYRDNQILIKFTDNGRGIDFNQVRQRAVANKLFRNPSDANDKNQLLKALFSPGFSTLEYADLHGGRGVGLSLVKERIKDLLGNITVSTAPGRGTTFTISIPMELPVLANMES